MKLNNKAFLLYDALLALSILSFFILFFLSFLNLIQKHNYYYELEYKAISLYRESLFNYEKNEFFIDIEEENIYSIETKGEYCVFYKSIKEEKKICYKK